MVGIIIAMDKELAPLTEGRKTVKTEEGGKEFYRFDVDGVECVAVKSGIGKVNAAYAATLLVRGFRPDYLVSTGISGGLGRHGLLELVAAEKTVCAEDSGGKAARAAGQARVSKNRSAFWICSSQYSQAWVPGLS